MSTLRKLLGAVLLLALATPAFASPSELAARAANARSDFQKLYDAYEQLQTSHVDVKGNDDPAYGRRKELEDKMAALEPRVTEAYNRMMKAEADLRSIKQVPSSEAAPSSPTAKLLDRRAE